MGNGGRGLGVFPGREIQRFLREVKTEREAASFIEEEAKRRGFLALDSVETIGPGEGVYQVRASSAYLAFYEA